MKVRLAFVSLAMIASAIAQATIFTNQPPAPGGGTLRWSKLWVDPSGQGNDLDGDAICYEDFVLTTAAAINHIEWWGDAPPNHGFQIEFWKQDPGTIAYQPYAVFRSIGAQPQYATTTTAYAFSITPGSVGHYSFDFASPIALAANDVVNPRWFVSIIGLTDVAYLEWNWAQGTGGSNNTFQFVRGGNEGGGDQYRVLGDGRALVLSGSAVPEPAAWAVLGIGLLSLIRPRKRR
jgi:hypothetical protein